MTNNVTLSKTYMSEHWLRFTKKVPSTDGTKTYIVQFGPTEYELVDMTKEPTHNWSCTCPDWQYRRKHSGTICKHIRAVQVQDDQFGGRCLWRGDEEEIHFTVSQDTLRDVIESGYPDSVTAKIFVEELKDSANAIVPLSESFGQKIQVIDEDEYIQALNTTTVPKYRGIELDPNTYAKYFVLLWIIQQLKHDSFGSSPSELATAQAMYTQLRGELNVIIDITKPFVLKSHISQHGDICPYCSSSMTYLPPFSANILSEQSVCTSPKCDRSVNHQSTIDTNQHLAAWADIAMP